ncbi:MAG TPA: LapA family protein [Nocardia sp.]|uniref:LapA family protein n=1 Tax=Nocardia TaxID=1817 RepID=UPI0024590514|nr:MULTISPECIES: LapA family protein [Nocardia]HLS77061.1 LapA family protein [Nocardia sp.]
MSRRAGSGPAHAAEPEPRRSLLARVSPTQWLALVLVVLALVFIFANRRQVEIEFLLVTVRSPLWLILLLVFAIGWLVGALTARRRTR